MKKVYVTLGLLAFTLLGYGINTQANELAQKDAAAVVEDSWDEFSLYSYQFDGDSDKVTIFMDEKKDKDDLLKHLKENLSGHDRDTFEIEIFETNIAKLEKN